MATTTVSKNNPSRKYAALPPPNAAPPDSGALDENLSPDVQHGESTAQNDLQRLFQAAPPPVQLHSRPTPRIGVQPPRAIDDVNTGSAYPWTSTSSHDVGSRYGVRQCH
ncbi:hypothetical protein H2248_011128 [Termitomyces sp. 'cryptogamus']|nr:hypothetical protein H2248_011128 [Termitomyces sp. 'cryptogamus']